RLPSRRIRGRVPSPRSVSRWRRRFACRGNSRQGCRWCRVARADGDSQVSALGVDLPSGAPFRCKHRLKHRNRAPGQQGLRVGDNLLGRNLDGNQIAREYRTCAGHADLLFRDGGKPQAGKCDCLLEFTSRPELALRAARESGHNRGIGWGHPLSGTKEMWMALFVLPAKNWLRFSGSIPPLFVLSPNMPTINTPSKLASLG